MNIIDADAVTPIGKLASGYASCEFDAVQN